MTRTAYTAPKMEVLKLSNRDAVVTSNGDNSVDGCLEFGWCRAEDED